jgi:transcription elongation factor Elf1
MPLAKRKAKRKKTRRRTLSCPFCGENEEVYVDPGGGSAQVYTEDCAVCCRPRVVHVEPGDDLGEVRVWLERGD